MISLHRLELEDKAWIDPLVMAENTQSADFSFGSMLIWNEAFIQYVGRLSDRLIVRVETEDGVFHAFPVGSGPLVPVLSAMIEASRQKGEPLTIYGATQAHKDLIEKEMPGVFSFKSEESFYDYIYEIDKLADLPGRKLHAKKNHVNKFMTLFPDWRYEDMTPAHFKDCLQLLSSWDKGHDTGEAHDQIAGEAEAIRRALDNFEALQFEGGVLYANGQICAFTIGEKNSPDTMIVHFEKADTGFEGSYAMINRQFAIHVRKRHPEIRCLNRCDDMGLESLRKAKHSYRPFCQVVKYTMTLN